MTVAELITILENFNAHDEVEVVFDNGYGTTDIQDVRRGSGHHQQDPETVYIGEHD